MQTKDLTTNPIMLDWAQHYHSLGANIIPLRDRGKTPSLEWKSGPVDFSTIRQSSNDLIALRTKHGLPVWESATGLAIVNGIGGWYSIDFDYNKVTDTTVPVSLVYDFVTALGYDPQTYPWLIRSGSGKGFHVWFQRHETEGKVTRNGPSVRIFLPTDASSCTWSKIELRCHDCYTVAPPSNAEFGRQYQFACNLFPTGAPAVLDPQRVIEVLNEIGDQQEHRREHLRSKVDYRQTLEYLPSDIERVKEKFDLLTAVKNHLGEDDVVDAGHEWRIGKPGSGHGGWHVTKDNLLWNNFHDGTGRRGGDCFDFIGYEKFDAGWNRNAPDMFKVCLAIAAIQSGVSLQTPNAQQERMGGSLKPTRAEIVEGYVRKRYVLRRNALTSLVEWQQVGCQDWVRITDDEMNGMLVDLEKATGIVLGKEAFRIYTNHSGIAPEYHPFRAYFDSLVFDGNDHVSHLLDCIGTHDREHLQTFFVKWLVATYACAYYGGFENRNELFLVLAGSQGCGKTTLLNY